MKLILQNKQCEGLETLTVTVVLQIHIKTFWQICYTQQLQDLQVSVQDNNYVQYRVESSIFEVSI